MNSNKEKRTLKRKKDALGWHSSKKKFFFFLTANFSTKTQKKAKQANNKHSQRQ